MLSGNSIRSPIHCGSVLRPSLQMETHAYSTSPHALDGCSGQSPQSTLCTLGAASPTIHCQSFSCQRKSVDNSGHIGGVFSPDAGSHLGDGWYSAVTKYFYNHCNSSEGEKIDMLAADGRTAIVPRWMGLSTRSTQKSTEEQCYSAIDSFNGTSALFSGSEPLLPTLNRRLYDPNGPVMFSASPLEGATHTRGEVRPWMNDTQKVISQNSSKRKVHRGVWLSAADTSCAFPVAMKFVEDANSRDGRSIKREIECHLYIYQRLGQLMPEDGHTRMEDAWPCAEMFGYHLDKRQPGRSVLITRKLSGPDFFDVIRTEHNSLLNRDARVYEYRKLQWCTLAMKRISQYGKLGIRHNDIKPDNIVLDFYEAHDSGVRVMDVKIIDLGTASMCSAKDFTGGTSWYESPEQKLLEFHTKKQRNPEAAKEVDIGLSSDAWGAGMSITEVLMGRRVVDALKTPHGPGPLDYRGGVEGWAMDPSDWVECARHALGLHKSHHTFPVCAEAARYVFDSLVTPHPEDRATLRSAIDRLDEYTEQAHRQVRSR